MHPSFAPAAAVFCPAMLLLALLASPTAFVAVNTSTPCATASCGNHTITLNTSTPCTPVLCGNLSIANPFWLAGTHPPECGYKAFHVTCDKGNGTLKNSFWTYQILDFFYENRSFRVTNDFLLDGTCNSEVFSNASTDLGLAPFKISSQNNELFFLHNCHRQARQLPRSWTPVSCANNSSNSFALLGKKYTPGGIGMLLPANCNDVSMMPVLGYEGATGADYQRLLKRGFLLEYTPDGCEDCTESGGRCRIDVNNLFWCHCSNGDYLFITF